MVSSCQLLSLVTLQVIEKVFKNSSLDARRGERYYLVKNLGILRTILSTESLFVVVLDLTCEAVIDAFWTIKGNQRHTCSLTITSFSVTRLSVFAL